MAPFKNVVTTQSDWSSGTLDDVVATASGDLELANNPALSFDESMKASVDIPHSASLNVQNLTLEAWVKLRSYTNYSTIVGKWHDGSDKRQYQIAVRSDGTVRFDLSDVGTWDLNYMSHTTTEIIPIGSWVHVAATYDGQTKKVYFNGTEVLSVNLSIPIFESTTPAYIGGYNSGSQDRYSDALIDEVRIWNVARTQSQIQTDMHRRLTGTEPGLVGYWRFDEGSGTIAYDATPNANHGTIRGAAWTTSGTRVEQSGTRTSPILDLSPVGTAAGSSIFWTATTPEGTSVTVETNLSLDDGQTWQGWQTLTAQRRPYAIAEDKNYVEGETWWRPERHDIPGIEPGMDLSNVLLQTRVTLSTTNTTVTPQLHDLTLSIGSQITALSSTSVEVGICRQTLAAMDITADVLGVTRTAPIALSVGLARHLEVPTLINIGARRNLLHLLAIEVIVPTEPALIILDKDRRVTAFLPGVSWSYTRRINEATLIEIHIPREVVDERITHSHALYGFFAPSQPLAVQAKPQRNKPNKAQYAEIAAFVQVFAGGRLKASGKITSRTLGEIVTIQAYTEEILLESNLTPAQYGMVWDGWDLADVARDLLDGWQSIRVKDQSQWQSYMVASSNIDLTTDPGHVMLAKRSNGRYYESGHITLAFEAGEIVNFKRWDRIRWSADSEDPVKTTIQYSTDGANWSTEFDGGLPEEIGLVPNFGTQDTVYVRINLYTNDTESEDSDGNPVGVTPIVFAVEVIARTEGQLLAGNIPDVAGVTVKGIDANHASALKVLLDACEQNGWEFQVVNGALSIAENLGTDRTKDFVLRAGTNIEITSLGDDDEELVNILTAYGPGSGINRMEITLRDDASIAQYGEYPAAVEFDANTLAELQTKAQEYLDTHNTPAVAFEVAAVFDTEYEPEYVIGDRVRVVDPETGIVTTTRIMAEHREYSENGLIVQLQLGKTGLNLQSALERIGGPPKPRDPDPPTGVYAKGIIAGIVVGCAAPRGDWAYTECHVSGSKDFIPSPSTLVTKGRQTRFEITGLEMGERYYARLVHVDSRGRRSGPSGEASAVADFVPVDDWTQEPPPPVPSGLSLSTGLEYVGQITWSRIIASWEATPETAYYLVRYRRVGEGADQWQESATTGTTQKLTPVAGNVQYEVQVRAVGPVGNASTWSAAKTITTARDTSAPAAPVFVEYGGIVKGIYVVLQTPSEEDWDGFEIHVSDSGAGFTPSPSTLKAKGRQTRFEITGLVPGRMYYVKAIAYDTSGNKSAPAY